MPLALAQAPPSAGRTPKSLDQIPLYPGAVRGEGSDTDCNKYNAGDAIEKVVRFYAQRLGSREFPAVRGDHGELESPEPFDKRRDQLHPGENSGVFHSIGFYPSELGAKLDWTKNRPPHSPGQWVQVVRFDWAWGDTPGNVKQFTLELEDTSAAALLAPESPKTLMTACVLDFGIGVEGEEEASPEEEKPEPETPHETSRIGPPSEKELGMPLYPNAHFTAPVSTSMSSEDTRYYVYTTGDASPKVVQFYESRTGRKATVIGTGHFVVLKGQAPFPDLGVSIEVATPELRLSTRDPNARTVITIMKKTAPARE